MLGALSGGNSLGTLFVRLTADATQLVRGMEQSRVTIERNCAVILKQVGMVTAGLAAMTAAVAAAGVKQATDFETSFTGVRKTVNATEEEFKKLESTFRGMSRTMPTNVNDINAIAEAAGQLGIKNENLTSFTKTIIDLGNSTNLASSEGATQLARFANITGMSQDKFSNLGSTLVGLGNKLATTEAEIMSMAMRIAGAGSQVGLSEDQIVSFAGALSSVGIEAEAGGTAISQMMIKMAKSVATGSKELDSFAAAAGMSSKEFSEVFQKDATAAILQFLKGLRAISNAGGDVFTTLEQIGLDGIRLTDVMLRASGSGNLFTNALKLGSQAWKENSALTEEANKRYQTFASQLTITWNIIKDMLITIGQELIPVLKAMNNMFVDSTKSTGDFSNSFNDFVKNVAPVFMKIVGGIGDAIMGWKLIIKAGETAFLSWAASILGIFISISKGISNIMVGIVNGVVNAINSAVNAANKLLPDSAQLGNIDLQMKVDSSAFDAWVEGFRQAAAESRKELEEMAAKPMFSDKLEAEYKKVTKVAVEEGTKAANEVKKMNETVQKSLLETLNENQSVYNKQAEDTARVSALLKKLQEKDPSLQLDFQNMALSGGGLGDADAGMAMQLQKDLELAKSAQAELQNLASQDLALTDAVQAQKLAMLEAYNERVKALQYAQAEVVLNSASSTFDSLASISAAFAGKQSGVYKAMFAVSKAFAIAESIIKIQQGIANALSLGWPMGIVAAASVAAQAASIVSNIQSVQLEFGGAREGGGPVSGGKAYLVGEKGPELMVPEGNGTIVPNGQLQGGQSVKVIINNHTDAQSEVRESQQGEEKIIEVIIRRMKDEFSGDIRDGRGPIPKALETSYNVRRGAR